MFGDFWGNLKTSLLSKTAMVTFCQLKKNWVTF